MADLEELLRETFRERENDVTVVRPFRVREDMPPRPGVFSRFNWLIPACATVAVVVGIAVVALPDDTADAPEPTRPVELVGDVRAAPAGMQAVSSLGIEIFVPADWSLNDAGCGQTSAPSVVRGVVSSGDCFAPEPADKTLVLIGPRDIDWLPVELTDDFTGPRPGIPVQPMTLRATTIDRLRAERGEAQLPDGRAVAVLRFTADDVAVVVRTPDAPIIEAIFASLRFVDRDHAGCPTTRPDALSIIAESTADPLGALGAVESATICSYPTVHDDDRLGSSRVVYGAELAKLTAELSQLRLRFDPTPDLSLDSCSDPRPVPEEHTVLALRLTDGTTRYVVIAAWGCAMVIIAATHDGAASLLGGQLYQLLLEGPPDRA